MAQQISIKVPFVVSTVSKCICLKCPVQAKSQCAAELKKGLREALRRNPLKHEEIPAAYCSAGKATCTDLDPSKSCICSGCLIFAQYKLENGKVVGYYCRDGASR